MRFANDVGFCELNDFPGCNVIVVSNHAFIYPDKRGKGHGHKNHELRVERAKYLGYDLIMCTVRANNIAEKKILTKHKWKLLHTFNNKQTSNAVELWVKDLT